VPQPGQRPQARQAGNADSMIAEQPWQRILAIVNDLFRQRIRTAVAADRDKRQAVHVVQFTKCRSVAARSRRFGMDAELCGCAVLGGVKVSRV